MPSERDDKIGPTAYYTAYVWQQIGMPYADLFATSKGAAMFWSFRMTAEWIAVASRRVPSMTEYLAIRHRLIEHRLAELEPDRVAEIGSGLSRRGVTWAADRGVPYVEIDLPHMIAAKRARLSRAPADVRARIADKLTFRSHDVTSAGFADALARELEGARQPVVIAEGLLGYFDFEERERVVSSVRQALARVGGGSLLCDLRAREGGLPVAAGASVLRAGIRLVTRGRGARGDFDDVAHVRRFFAAAGFEQRRAGAAVAVARPRARRHAGEDLACEGGSEGRYRMSYGKNVDLVAGGLSRILHVRGAKQNTLAEADAYLDLPVEKMFPAPPLPRDLKQERSLLDRAINTTTLRWTSDHQPISPAYQRRHDHEYKANHVAWARWLRPDGRRRSSCLVYVHGWLEPGSWAEESTLFRKWARELDVDHGARVPAVPRQAQAARFAILGRVLLDGGSGAVHRGRAAGAVRRARGDGVAPHPGLRPDRRHGSEPRRCHRHAVRVRGAATRLHRAAARALEARRGGGERADLVAREARPRKWGIHEADRRTLFRRIGWSEYKPVLPPERQLWVEARDDVYIDAAKAEQQWREWGEPPIVWIDGGHMTFPLSIDRITDAMGDFRRGLP